jgi:hypothetical protein
MPTTESKPTLLKKDGWTRIEGVTFRTDLLHGGSGRYAGKITGCCHKFKREAVVEIPAVEKPLSCASWPAMLVFTAEVYSDGGSKFNLVVEGEDDVAEDLALTLYCSFTCRDWEAELENRFTHGLGREEP